MDYLSLLQGKDLVEYSENFNYNLNFMGQQFFTPMKTKNIKAVMRSLVENGNLPVMALVHAFDAEAHIGDRPNFKELELQKLFIKEKINASERIIELKNDGVYEQSDVIKYIFDDAGNMLRRVVTRTEVMNMELLATGKVTAKENNVTYEVDYGVPAGNKTAISGWNQANHGIVADINTQIAKAKKKGYKIVRAITSSKMVGYMLANTEIKGYFANAAFPLTESVLLNWLMTYFGIEFVVNDDYYKTSAQATTGYRFFPENVITFVTTAGAVGAGLFGVTPEELALGENVVAEKAFAILTQWKAPDPVAVWTKASALYVPVLTNPDGLFICTHTDSN